jgi:hypothetical protein
MTHGGVFFSGEPWLAGDGAGHRSYLKPPRNLTKFISFSSFFHKESKSTNGFLWFLTEMKKRREQSLETKTQKRKTGQIEQN